MNIAFLGRRSILLAALATICSLSGVRADDFFVTSTADDGSPGTLRSAIELANASTARGDVFVVEGVITITSGLPALGNDIHIHGAGPDKTIIQGSPTQNDPLVDWRIFGISPGATVSIEGVTIRHGVCEVPSGFDGFGGGIRNAGTLTLDNCVIANNNVRITGVAVTGNESRGGGISNNGTLNLLNSVVTGNVVTGGTGSTGGGKAKGGGVNCEPGTTITIMNSTISGNQADGGVGGTAGGDAYGGGLFLETGVSTLITRSTISGNTAFGGVPTVGSSAPGMGGGLAAIDNEINKIRMRLCTISGNLAGPLEGQGGGIMSGAGLTIDSCTITSNQAAAVLGGGGLYVLPTAPATGPYMRNSILSGNTDGASLNDLTGRLTSKGFNLVGQVSIAVGDFDEDGSESIAEGNHTGVQPGLLALGDFGGPTLTHGLMQSSLAFNGGTDSFVDGTFTTTDQRGFPRVATVDRDPLRILAPDIGAFELQNQASAVSRAFDLYE